VALDLRGVATASLAGTWLIDPPAASVAFSGRVSRLAPAFAARFGRVAGTVALPDGNADGDGGRVDVDVDLASMTTGRAAWDDLLAAVDPFDARTHPTGRYRSARVRLRGGRAVVDGALVLRGTAVPVRLTGSSTLLGRDRARLRARGEVDRRCFGLRVDLPGYGLLVPARMRVEVDVEVVRQGEADPGLP
jgi:polyisoprenoid-binding protein YceI